MVGEIKEVREKVQTNSAKIEKLFDLRQADRRELAKEVEQIVVERLGCSASRDQKTADANERMFLCSRRSVRIWPVRDCDDLMKAARRFFKDYLLIPPQVSDAIFIEKTERVQQARRSKIGDELLVVFRNAQDRDVIQSYAPNLALAKGQAGLRLDVPDHLRGVFRQFEAHAAALRQTFGSVKRSIRLDDVSKSLIMDVKLENTAWHRLTAEDMSRLAKNKQFGRQDSTRGSALAKMERQLILLAHGPKPQTGGNVNSESEAEDDRESTGIPASRSS